MPVVGLPPRGINSIQNVRGWSNMELHGWQQCQRKACTAGTLSLLPPLDIFSSIYSQVLRLVNKFPHSYNKRVVLYFAYKGTTVELDLGDVKAAGVVCILGLGVGLGTLFIYRLYHQYIRPFLDIKYPDPESPSSDDHSLLLDSSDSGVDGAMGNSSSGPTPAVFYSPEYGVALGRRMSPNGQDQLEVDSVRLRRMGTLRKPPCRINAERDSPSGRSSNLIPPQYEPNFRESFYSTTESGFETLPELVEEEETESADELSPSLKENFSASSLKERSDRYFASAYGNTAGSSSSGDNIVPLPDQAGVNGDHSVPVVHMELASSSEKSSPVHSGSRVPDAHLLSAKKGVSFSHSEDFEDDPSLDASESLRSFNSSGEDWSWEEEEKDMSPYPSTHTAMTDSQFRQSLMQRIRHWSTFAEEYGKSRSPTPDCSAPLQSRLIRRSRSLDHHLGDPVLVPEVDMSSVEPASGQDATIRNLENLETEFHDIQGEFESITSKLHELIEKGTSQEHQQPPLAKSSPSRRPNLLHLNPSCYHIPKSCSHNNSPHHRPKTKWERMPSLPHSDSSRSSRASSVEFSWDCGEVGGDVVGARDSMPGGSLQTGEGPAGDAGAQKEEGMATEELPEHVANKVTNVGTVVPIVEYAAQEWKGDTPKSKTIKQGYLAISELFHCQHLRRVRGDNYCALRSTLFQVLVAGHRVTHRWPGLISIIDRLHELNADMNSGLHLWSFAGRLPWEGEEEKFSKIAQ